MKWLPRILQPAPACRIEVNGVECPLNAGQTLAEIVQEQADQPSRVVAAAINDKVVPKSQWSCTPLQTGDRIRLVTPIASG